MTTDWHNIYITDKSGRKMWGTTASPMSTMSEIRNLQGHLKAAAKYQATYPNLDLPSAVLMLDGEPYENPLTMTDDELLTALGA